MADLMGMNNLGLSFGMILIAILVFVVFVSIRIFFKSLLLFFAGKILKVEKKYKEALKPTAITFGLFYLLTLVFYLIPIIGIFLSYIIWIPQYIVYVLLIKKYYEFKKWDKPIFLALIVLGFSFIIMMFWFIILMILGLGIGLSQGLSGYVPL